MKYGCYSSILYVSTYAVVNNEYNALLLVF